MSLENFNVLLEMDNIKQHIQVGLRNIAMTQYSSSHKDGKERGLNIVCIKPHSIVQLIDGNVEQTTLVPLCDLTVPAKNGSDSVPTKIMADIGLVRLDCNAYRLFKLVEVYQSIIKSLDIKPPDVSEIELPETPNADSADESGSKILLNVRSFVVNLSCHENGLERPVLKTEISDLVLNFFSYEDGGKLILRTNLGIEHFDTHAVVWQPTFESLLFHIEGRFPKSGRQSEQ